MLENVLSTKEIHGSTTGDANWIETNMHRPESLQDIAI
jgi:hypothetical protein